MVRSAAGGKYVYAVFSLDGYVVTMVTSHIHPSLRGRGELLRGGPLSGGAIIGVSSRICPGLTESCIFLPGTDRSKDELIPFFRSRVYDDPLGFLVVCVRSVNMLDLLIRIEMGEIAPAELGNGTDYVTKFSKALMVEPSWFKEE